MRREQQSRGHRQGELLPQRRRPADADKEGPGAAGSTVFQSGEELGDDFQIQRQARRVGKGASKTYTTFHSDGAAPCPRVQVTASAANVAWARRTRDSGPWHRNANAFAHPTRLAEGRSCQNASSPGLSLRWLGFYRPPASFGEI